MSPLLLTYLGLKDGVFGPVMSCFAVAIQEVLGTHVGWDYTEGDPAVVRARVLHLGRLLRELEDDERLDLFDLYLSKVKEQEPSIVEEGFDARRLANQFFDAIEQGTSKAPSSGTTAIARVMNEEDSASLAAHHLGMLRPDRMILIPAAYICEIPFVPTEATANCLAAVVSSAQKSDRMSLEQLHEDVERKGVDCSLVFLAMVAACDHRLLSLFEDGAISVVRRDDFLPGLESLAHNMRRSDLVSGGKRITVPDENGFRTCTFEPPKINRERVSALVVRKHALQQVAGIDWDEVGVKMLSITLNGEITVQGLSASLHAEIVRALRTRGEAMTLDQLQRALCLPLAISPEDLPPGQIMAYAPHPRFLKPENAVYVLKDWVETDTEKRGRILRSRVITPFQEKNWEFSPTMLAEVIRNDELYKFCGLITLDSIVEGIVARLQDRPNELYYRNLIRARSEKLLDVHFIDLGRGVFTNDANAIERMPNQSNDSWRLAVLHAALGRPRNLLRSIESIENAAVRTQLVHVARGLPSDGYLHL